MVLFVKTTRRRRDGKPEKLGRVFAQEAKLGALSKRAGSLQAAKAALWPYLPPSSRQHCDLANIRDSTLYIVADSPVWAARLRHTSRQILHAARDRCKIPVTGIKVRISPRSTPKRPRRQPKQLSDRARDHLKAAAETTSDPDLAKILKRIGKRD